MLVFQLAPDLRLQPLEAADVPVLFALVERNRRYLQRWLPWVDENATEEETRAFVESTIQERLTGESLHLGIWMRDALVGVVAFNEIDREAARAEVGYWVDESVQGSGLVTRACRALLAHGFEDLALERIEILTEEGNVRSRRMAERLGFRREGDAARGVRRYVRGPGP